MIENGYFEHEGVEYDRYIIPSHWRYSATIIGLIRYFNFHRIPYFIDGRNLYYNYEYVNDTDENLKRYYDYIEYAYSEFFSHTKVFNDESLDDASLQQKLKEIRYLNPFLKKIDWGKERKDIILSIENIIKDNRKLILEKTYINNPFGYSNYLQRSCFRKANTKSCRVLDYYIDVHRKGNSVNFGFTTKSYTYDDCIEFDYIPFGFTYGFSSCIINCNYDIDTLLTVNNQINDYLRKSKKKNYEVIFLSELINIIPCPVEVVIRDEKYDSFIYREKSKAIFAYMLNNHLNQMDLFFEGNFEQIPVGFECVRNVINLVDLDSLIYKLLKLNYFSATMQALIKTNTKMYQEFGRLKFKNDDEIDRYIDSTDVVYQALLKNNNVDRETRLLIKCLNSLSENDFNLFLDEMMRLSSKEELPFDFLRHTISKGSFINNKNLVFSVTNKIAYSLLKKKGVINEKQSFDINNNFKHDS